MTRLFVCLMVLAVPGPAGAEPRPLPFTADWTLRNQVTPETVMGVPALTFRTGAAYFHGVAFRDGTITFDVATTPRRAFIGLRFRAASEDRFEEVYFRPHKSGLPDAVQYAPAFAGGRSQWQLYHGPGETAAATFAHDGWLAVRVVVKDRRAAVFLGGATEPVLVVDRLAHEPAAGFIGFWSFDNGEVAPGEQTTSVANVVVHPGDTAYAFPPPRTEEMPAGVIRQWEVAPAFAAPAGPVLGIDPPPALAWRAVETEPNGLLPFDRVLDWPSGARRATALARFQLPSSAARTVRLHLGFSDDVSVFLNGTLVYSGVHGYSYNFPRRDGLITFDQATLYLPLRAGENTVILAVSDTFGGWGAVARRQ